MHQYTNINKLFWAHFKPRENSHTSLDYDKISKNMACILKRAYPWNVAVALFLKVEEEKIRNLGKVLILWSDIIDNAPTAAVTAHAQETCKRKLGNSFYPAAYCVYEHF